MASTTARACFGDHSAAVSSWRSARDFQTSCTSGSGRRGVCFRLHPDPTPGLGVRDDVGEVVPALEAVLSTYFLFLMSFHHKRTFLGNYIKGGDEST
jgi:hypothetical protein